MLDLGTSFLASVARDPDALAIVDGELRLTYDAWYRKISALVAGFDDLGLHPGDHLVTLLQNRWEAATIHWACQFAGVIITPLNWRSSASELDFCLDDSEAKAIVYEEVSAEAVRRRAERARARGSPWRDPHSHPMTFEALIGAERRRRAAARRPRCMVGHALYLGHDRAPEGRAAPAARRARRALAHVAQNLYGQRERTLGAMPLYHTMGVRSLLAMSLIGGAFVCLPRFDVARALELIAAEKLTNLYLVPTLYHDLLHHERFQSHRRELGAQARLRRRSDDGRPAAKPQGRVQAGPVRQSLWLIRNLHLHHRPERRREAGLGRTRRHQPDGARRAAGRDLTRRGCRTWRGRRVIALLAGDESFEGYWRRPDADAKALRHGWYFTGDTGYFDRDGDLFVTGRVDDMIITGGENVSPVEIESCLSLHPRCWRWPSSGWRTNAGERSSPLSSNAAALSNRRSSINSAATRASPISSVRAATSSSRRSRNRPSGSSCAASCWRASTSPSKRPRRPRKPASRYTSTRNRMMSSTFADPRLATLDGFRVDIDPARERADVILDRPPLNVISMPQRDQLRLLFEALEEDERVRVIVLRAVGEHFSSGGNIKGFLEATPELVSRLAWNIAAPARCAKPVIAANRGYCFGVGFELSLACDFRIVSETCFYALPEQRLGQIPGSGGSARLQKIIGITRTKDIVMRSRRIPAKQAYDWGIATECVPDDKLEATTDALVDELRAFSPLAQRTAKKLLNDTEDATLSLAIELEGHCYSRLRQSDDFREGVEAFHAKRPARFKGT
jgi:2-oxoglutaroyl-CoA hydrolase